MTSHKYKSYADSQLSRYPHAIVVYQLIDEDAITVSSPMFSPAGGTYTDAQDVEISCTTEGASIYYTTDGTASKEGVVGFYLVNNDVAIQERRCYLEIDDDKIAPSRLVFDFGETNSIMDKNCDDNNSSVFYNLNGQQVTNPTRGIYIWNNRKVLMR